MKALCQIATLFLATQALASASNDFNSIQAGEVCNLFIKHVETARYQQAYKLLSSVDSSACNTPDVVWGRATVLAVFGKLDSALVLAEVLSKTHPDIPKYSHLHHRLRSLSKMTEQEKVAELIPNKASEDDPDKLIAWLEKDVPVTLDRMESTAIHFPVHREGYMYYSFSAYDENEAPGPEQNHISKWPASDLGPATKLPDGRLVVSALLQKPYAFKPAHYALYTFDPAKPKAKPGNLAFCTPGANEMHASYDPLQQVLYFSSDKPGGNGGMDLWKVPYNNGAWGAPENVGQSVNSPWDELFAFAHGDTLFYSSNRADRGYGGVDTYYLDQKSGSTGFLAAPVNSPYDDFNLNVASTEEAYIVSNRPMTGTGDRIFKFVWQKPQLFFPKLKGSISGIEGLGGMQAYLINVDGDTLQSTFLDKMGHFQFDAVRGMRAYTVSLAGPLPANTPLDMRLLDEQNNMVKRVYGNSSQGFVFELLTPEDYTLERMKEEDQSILDIDIFGQVLEEQAEPSKGLKIVLLNPGGETIASAQTNQEGYFKFESVKPDDYYTIKADAVKANTTIHLLDQSGRLIQTIEPGQDSSFVYVRIDPEVRSITLTNELKQKVKVAEGTAFELPQVYFDYGSAELNTQSRKSLDKLLTLLRENDYIRVELSAHTDSRGDAGYNLRLSQRRIDAAVAYLLQSGVASSRIAGKGYGEGNVLNHCTDGVECTEAEHAINRRIEFSVFDNDQ